MPDLARHAAIVVYLLASTTLVGLVAVELLARPRCGACWRRADSGDHSACKDAADDLDG